MAKKGKKFLEAQKLVDRTTAYSVEEAIELVKKTNFAKFDATVEVAFRLGVDTRKNDQQIRGAVVLHTVLVKLKRFLYSLKAKKQKKQKLLALTS